ncbi:MAG: FKBP-type peptidyl-prolyl cis-trans isomerase [Bdellovibrionia bacterium]
MKISKNSVVSIQYTLCDDSKQVLDQSEAHDPLVYLHGSEAIIPGLEKALEGKSAGDRLTVSIPPEEAYGLKEEGLTDTLSRDEFPEDEELEVGESYEVETDDGYEILTITDIQGDEVTVDTNHPLAGQTLHFEVEVTDVREATDEEIEHGHPHTPNTHHTH